jgi:hypothetical protein
VLLTLGVGLGTWLLSLALGFGYGEHRARSHCRFAPPLIHFIPYLLTYSVPLSLKRQCDRTPGGKTSDPSLVDRMWSVLPALYVWHLLLSAPDPLAKVR